MPNVPEPEKTYSFKPEVIITCPKCGGDQTRLNDKIRVIGLDNDVDDGAERFICSKCGHHFRAKPDVIQSYTWSRIDYVGYADYAFSSEEIEAAMRRIVEEISNEIEDQLLRGLWRSE